MTAICVVGLWLLAVAGVVEVGVRLLQFTASIRTCLGRRTASQTPVTVSTPADDCAFVSVHIPTHDEPPDLVIATLRALAQSRRCGFEVIVLDNNTPDPATWRPVQSACAELGAHVRFVHVDGVQGAKAGALNIALGLADPRTTHVAVIDADYRTDPQFLDQGLAALRETGADYVQFPQAYRGVTPSARGVEHELGDYFASLESAAGRPGSMLPTGTLSIFTLHALRAVGGWPTRTITEDAEIGLQLQRRGFRGLWLADPRGWGLLPLDFHGLQQQRARWAAGNMQVLRDVFRTPWPGLTPRKLVTLTVQLTAWLSLWLPLAAALVLAALAPGLPYARQMARLGAGAILLSAALTATRLLISSNGRRVGWKAGLRAVATKLALAWTSATAWLPALGLRSLAFRRTGKQIGSPRGRTLWTLAGASGGFLLLGGLYAARGQAPEALACVLLASAWPCARWVDAGLRAAARANPEIAPERACPGRA